MSVLFWIFILVLLAAGAAAAVLAYRTYFGNEGAPINLSGWLFRQKPEPRLGVTEQAVVDSRRRLVLIRRDDVEHLIMTGGPVDVLIETGIQGRQREEAPAAEERVAPVFGRPARNLGQAVNE